MLIVLIKYASPKSISPRILYVLLHRAQTRRPVHRPASLPLATCAWPDSIGGVFEQMRVSVMWTSSIFASTQMTYILGIFRWRSILLIHLLYNLLYNPPHRHAIGPNATISACTEGSQPRLGSWGQHHDGSGGWRVCRRHSQMGLGQDNAPWQWT